MENSEYLVDVEFYPEMYRNQCSLCRADVCNCDEEYPYEEYKSWDYE